MRKFLAITLLSIPFSGIAQPAEESPIRFAFYSPSWASNAEQNLLAGLRLVVDNQTDRAIFLESLEFAADAADTDPERIPVELDIPARRLAEKELPYTDLLSLNTCVNDTLQENWRLVEISNYTLNPSVRRLIIEDTSAFRIYQCVSSVVTRWTDKDSGEQSTDEEWVLYHFESKRQ